MNKGPLVRVRIGPNRFAKMYEQDAIARGLIPDPKTKGKKQHRPVADKRRHGLVQDKQITKQQTQKELITGQDSTSAGAFIVPEDMGISKPDNFAVIRGIGEATAEKLRARGILTFEQLAQADVSWLPGRTRRAVEDWRKK